MWALWAGTAAPIIAGLTVLATEPWWGPRAQARRDAAKAQRDAAWLAQVHAWNQPARPDSRQTATQPVRMSPTPTDAPDGEQGSTP